MPNWRRAASLALVEVPAAIVTVWYRMYVVLIALISIATVSMCVIALALYFGFGIRWGW